MNNYRTIFRKSSVLFVCLFVCFLYRSFLIQIIQLSISCIQREVHLVLQLIETICIFVFVFFFLALSKRRNSNINLWKLFLMNNIKLLYINWKILKIQYEMKFILIFLYYDQKDNKFSMWDYFEKKNNNILDTFIILFSRVY